MDSDKSQGELAPTHICRAQLPGGCRCLTEQNARGARYTKALKESKRHTVALLSSSLQLPERVQGRTDSISRPLGLHRYTSLMAQMLNRSVWPTYITEHVLIAGSSRGHTAAQKRWPPPCPRKLFPACQWEALRGVLWLFTSLKDAPMSRHAMETEA